MKFYKYIVLISILSCCIRKNLQEPGLVEKKKTNLNENLEKEIQSLIPRINEQSNYIVLSFYQKNDTNFLSILDDKNPPIFVDSCCYAGYMRYQNKWLIFTNYQSDSIFHKFVNKTSLQFDMKDFDLDNTSRPYDPKIRIYILKNDSLRYLKTIK